MTRPSIVYLLGSPGVGKRTVAHALARTAGHIVIDNQLVNIPVMTLFDWDGRSRLPVEIWSSIDRIRDAVLSALQDIAPPHLSYVLTNTLEEDEHSAALFDRVQEIARSRRAVFLPVLLTCSRDEQLRRVASADRVERMKLTDPVQTEVMLDTTTFYRPRHEDLLELDTTGPSADQSAQSILARLSALQRA